MLLKSRLVDLFRLAAHPETMTSSSPEPLIDPCGRQITYLRVSVTDRCDLRCTYCMSERMQFYPKAELLTFEELLRVSRLFIRLGVSKIRISGGEPLVRKGMMSLMEELGQDVAAGSLKELCLTTNATRLAHVAEDLVHCGVKRINVSLDTLDAERFKKLTRGGDLTQVLQGLQAAKDAGLAVKINAVALQSESDGLVPLIEWAHTEGFSVSLIETMPMGELGVDRNSEYLSLESFKDRLKNRWKLRPSLTSTGGPSRYFDVEETGGKLGFITPIANNFCANCNRVRLTCTGTLFPCLGQETKTDLRALLRNGADEVQLEQAVRDTIARKPEAHDFVNAMERGDAVSRHMSVTGG